ncbi:hypothetical protein HPB47_012323, partial [Ixodes persulcatus]
FELFDVSLASENDDRGTEHFIVDMKVLKKVFASTTYSRLSRCNERQYGLEVNLVLTCSSCDFTECHFSSLRVAGAAKMKPFVMNTRAMKRIQSIGKGATALLDFCATLNLFLRGLHHMAFKGHMDTMNFLNHIGNLDIIFDETWKTHGQNSIISVGCILELYFGLVLYHVVLSRYCRGSQGEPHPDDEGYEVSGEEWATLHDHSFQRCTFHVWTRDGIDRCLQIEKNDYLNLVHKLIGAALRTLVEKEEAQGESFGGKKKLSKSMHDSLLAVEVAIAEAVSGFKQDMATTSKAAAEQLGYSTGSCLTRRSLEKDKQRLSKADKAHTESEKVKKMAKRHKPNMTQDYCTGLT